MSCSSRKRDTRLSRVIRAVLAVALVGWGEAPVDAQDASGTDRTTYSIQYRVRINEKNPTVARVRWNLTGIDEIRKIRLTLRGDHFFDFSGSGTLERQGSNLLWTPASPYAHLEYRVRLRSRRSPTEGFDSYASSDWVITRAQALFPATHVTFETDVEREPRSRSRIVFDLPPGWRSYTAMEEISPGVFRPEDRRRRLSRPAGWIGLGRLDVLERTITGVRVIVAKAPGSRSNSQEVLDLYDRSLPHLKEILPFRPPRILIAIGPDPMWRGGLSGEASFFLHGDRPIRTPDHTSPFLHELFHLFARFHPQSDAHWISEGLAEFYSLELQRRASLLDEAAFGRGLRYFAKYGFWRVDLTAQRDNAATNNSAPLVMQAIDQEIRRRTRGRRSLDDAVREMAGRSEPVSTAGFLRAVNKVTGRDFTPFFQRHVYAGEPPPPFGVPRSSRTEPHARNLSP